MNNKFLLKSYIKSILKENKEYKTKMFVFDFDKTLYNSPEPDLDYKGPYWWNSKNSLQTLDHSLWIEDVVAEAMMACSNPEILSVMCTARLNRPEVMFLVNKLLREKGLDFDKVFYKDTNLSTSQYKAETIGMLLDAYPNIYEVQFWEDKQENLTATQEKCRQLGVDFIPHLVQ